MTSDLVKRLEELYQEHRTAPYSFSTTFTRSLALGSMLIDAWPQIKQAIERDGRDGWQPIETAPKDGTWVLLTGGNVSDDTGEDRPAVCQWTNDLNGRKTEWHWQHCWYDGGYYGFYDQPTHWMPLPAAPMKDKGGGE